MPVDGKKVLITGATGGIGRTTAHALVEQGAHVVVVGRNEERGKQVVEELGHLGSGRISFIAADLSAQSEVRRLAREVVSTFERLDVLINNVGGYTSTRKETVDGIEWILATTHLKSIPVDVRTVASAQDQRTIPRHQRDEQLPQIGTCQLERHSRENTISRLALIQSGQIVQRRDVTWAQQQTLSVRCDGQYRRPGVRRHRHGAQSQCPFSDHGL